MKVLRVTMPDGSKWDVPAKIIAEDRAKYYAEQDTKSITDVHQRKQEYDKVFNGEMNEALENGKEDNYYDLKDWAGNNMNWEDVKQFAKEFRGAQCMTDKDFQDGWIEGKQEVVDC